MISPRHEAQKPPSIADLYREAQVFHQRGALDEAARRYQSVVAASPGHFDSLHMLGILRAQQGKPDEGAMLIRRAISVNPRSAAAHVNLGSTLNRLRNHKEAANVLEKAVALDPADPVAHNNLGNAYRAMGFLPQAEASFGKAVSLNGDYAEALSNLGATLHKLDRDQEALGHLLKCTATNPKLIAGHINLGLVYAALDRSEEAVASLRQALALDSKNRAAWIDLADVYLAMGDIGQAREFYERAFALDRNDGRLHHRIANIKKFKPGDPQIAAMKMLLGSSRKPADVIALHFALAKAYEDLGDAEQSFAHLREANRLARAQMVYDEERTLAMFERMQRVFTPALIERLAGEGCKSDTPVFIVGMMRSGSTLVEQILASHPRVRALGELPDFTRAVAALHLDNGQPISGPEQISLLNRQQFAKLGEAYLASLRARAGVAERITDKALDNSRHVGLIHLALPNARIIHTRRDAVDTCLSCYSKFFTAHHPYAYDLGELGRYWRAHDRMMQHWRDVLPEGAMLEVQYEELVTDFAAQARRIIAYCGLEWDDACLSFHEAKRPVRTASVTQVRQPLYRNAVGRWRPDAETLTPLLAGLGIASPAGH